MDLLPTCLELAGAEYPESFKGINPGPIDGKSMIQLINKDISATHDTIFWEHSGGRAVRIGDWKMAALKGGNWELFDLSADRTEMNDLAEKYPEKIETMTILWEEWSKGMKLLD